MTLRGVAARYRDLILIGVACVLLIVITILGARETVERNTRESQLPYVSSTVESSGIAGLYRWAAALGYATDSLTVSPADPGALGDANALVFVGGLRSVTGAEANAIVEWVNAGGVLIYAPVVDTGLLERFDLYLERNLDARALATQRAPLGREAQLPPLSVASSRSIRLGPNANATVHFAVDQSAVVVSSPTSGAGLIIVISDTSVFTNRGLRDESTARIARAMLRSLPAGSRIVFNDYHNLLAPDGEQPRTTLFSEPWGWALIFGLLALLAYLLINGRAFGKPYPARATMQRRGVEEYATTMAGLYRRGGKRDAILAHYKNTLKRDLGRVHRVRSDIPDGEFVEELSRVHDGLDAAGLIDLLRDMNTRNISESQLVALARRAVAFTQTSTST
jgi:hypothetical protein